MKSVYCSKCNTQLPVTRKAYPKHAKILDVVEPHICPEIPLPLDLGTPSDVPPVEQKFVQKSNELQHRFPNEEEGLRDRRTDVKDIETSAPFTLLDQMRKLKGNG